VTIAGKGLGILRIDGLEHPRNNTREQMVGKQDHAIDLRHCIGYALQLTSDNNSDPRAFDALNPLPF
jgi:hypothetical protein